MINFNEEQKKKQRNGVSPRVALEAALKHASDIESVVIVSVIDGAINTSYSWESSLQALGMLDVSKQQILDSMNEE